MSLCDGYFAGALVSSSCVLAALGRKMRLSRRPVRKQRPGRASLKPRCEDDEDEIVWGNLLGKVFHK